MNNIKVNTQSSIRIQGEKVVYFDPFKIDGEPHDADLIFITHDHFDHFSPEDIKNVMKADTVFVVPERMNESIKEAAEENSVVCVTPGNEYQVCGLKFKTVPAYNRTKPFHLKSNEWCGYVVEIDGLRYYVAGDTDSLEENRQISCDVALVPVGGTYTMDAQQAAELINKIRPRVAVPTHYGSIVGSAADGESFRKRVDGEIEVAELIET